MTASPLRLGALLPFEEEQPEADIPMDWGSELKKTLSPASMDVTSVNLTSRPSWGVVLRSPPPAPPLLIPH